MTTEKTCMNCGTSGCDYKDTRVCAGSGSRSLWSPIGRSKADLEATIAELNHSIDCENERFCEAHKTIAEKDAEIAALKAKLEELTKGGEAVAFVQANPDGHLMLAEITKTEAGQQLDQWDKQMGWKLVPLYTHSLSVEALEQRTAEACARMVRGELSMDSTLSRNLLSCIRSGKWREYL